MGVDLYIICWLVAIAAYSQIVYKQLFQIIAIQGQFEAVRDTCQAY